VGVSAQRDAERAGETKVGQLEVAFLVDEQVLGLEVAMENAVAVAIADACTQLAHELLDHSGAQTHVLQLCAGAFGEGLAAAAVGDGQSLHVLFQVEIEELKDQVQLVTLGVDYVIEPDDGGVTHFLEERDLANGGGRHTLIFGFEADLLQGDNAPAIVKVAGFVDDAIGT
jgi:hypothetical protein